jgi:TctA family transporter
MMSQGDLSTLVTRPLSAGMLVMAALILLTPLLGRLNRWRVRAVAE